MARGKERPGEPRLSGNVIVSELIRNMELGQFEMAYTVLLPCIFTVYLNPEDFATLSGVLHLLREDARRALRARVAECNQKPAGVNLRKRGEVKEYRIACREWELEFLPESEIPPGDVEIHSELNEAAPIGLRGTRTTLIGREPSITQSIGTSDNGADVGRSQGIYAAISYTDDSGPQTYFVTGNQVRIGRGGEEQPVDLTIQSTDEISRHHVIIRRDPATGVFSALDASTNGTWINGKRLRKGTEDRLPKPRADRPRRSTDTKFRSARMSTSVSCLRAGTATHAGRERSENEDRVFADVAQGVFVVIDGMGGHAAGSTAAAIAFETIREELGGTTGADEARIRRAITAANNKIFAAAEANPAWSGMACVLTVAILDEDRLRWGHVGDSRLYLFSEGALPKLTADHSPVGEQEDRGQLAERDAMQHPRRNQVSRDVGLRHRTANEEVFIETGSAIFAADSALLLCSDGLSDVLTRSQLLGILALFAGDAEATAKQLVAAANEADGSDNVSAVFVAGPEFTGARAAELIEARSRHEITRVRKVKRSWLLARLFGRVLK